MFIILPIPLRTAAALLLGLLVVGSTGGALRAEGNLIAAVADTHNPLPYRDFLAGRDPLTITDFSGTTVRRDVVEFILLQQALRLGGLKEKIEIVFSPNSVRMVQIVRSGKYVISANTVWDSDSSVLTDEIYISPPIIRDGEYEAGIYALANNRKALSVSSIEELKQFSLVSNHNWVVDWRTLKGMGLTKLIDVPSWDMMVGLLTSSRVDLVLVPFSSSDDLSLDFRGQKFMPIPELKISLRGSRSFIVSKDHPDGQRVAEALARGVNILRKENRIALALEQSGFLNDKVKDWKILN